MLEYLDFEVEIRPGAEGGNTVEVLRSPAGEVSDSLQLPYDDLQLENRLQAIEIALLSSRPGRRRIANPAQQGVEEFGGDLFDSLFTPRIRSALEISREAAASQRKGLRIKLRCESPALSSLPWEFLYDRDRCEYLCLSSNTPVVRYLEVARRVRRLKVTPPLNVLAMVCSPNSLDPLDVAAERARIDQAVSRLADAGLVRLHWLEGQTWRNLQQALFQPNWHVFHFIGHGRFDKAKGEGTLMFAAEDGGPDAISATEAGLLLGDSSELRLTVLNSCEGARSDTEDTFSSTAASLVRSGVPAVLAMQYEISDSASIELARCFYEAVATGLPIDAAVGQARKAIRLALPNSFEWATPVLYMRSGDGALFDIDPYESKSPESSRIALKVKERDPEPVQGESGLDQADTDWVQIGRMVLGKLPSTFDSSPAGHYLQSSLNRLQGKSSSKPESLQGSPALKRNRPHETPQSRGTDPLTAQPDSPARQPTAYCRKCGTARVTAGRFCKKCGSNFD